MITSSKALRLRHEIFVLDADLLNPLDSSMYAKITTRLVNALLKALKMERLGNLEIFKAIDMRAPGWSFIQPITTSHISGHYFEKPGKLSHLHLDIYSCKRFSCAQVIRILDEHLKLADWSANFVIRHTSHTSRRVNGLEGYGSITKNRYDCVPRRKN